MATDEGWAIEPEIAELIRPQSPQDAGKTHLQIGYYRINLPATEPDNLYEFETIHFINVNGKLNIGGFPHLIAQLRHGEIVHVYGTRGDSASFFDDEGTEVAPLATLAGGRRRAHVRLPYFGAANEKCGWMTVGSWMVPMEMRQDRPFQLLTADFTVDKRGRTYFSWDPNHGPLDVGRRLNHGSELSPSRRTVLGSSAFQFTSAIGYLDAILLNVPRWPRRWQPRGARDDYILEMELEEVLLRNGGTWRQLQRLEQTDYSNFREHLPDFRTIRAMNHTLATSVALLAVHMGYTLQEVADIEYED